jgi:hypothetical protein
MNGLRLFSLAFLLLAAAGCESQLNHQMSHEKKVEAELAALDARLAALEATLARIEAKLPPRADTPVGGH